MHISARDAIEEEKSPIIVDNTNVYSVHMKPYANLVCKRFDLDSMVIIFCFFQAIKNGYEVYFVEPDTKWKFNANECTKCVVILSRSSK